MPSTPSTRTTLLQFRSSSLMRNTLYDAHTGDLVFRLFDGYMFPTIPVDHGGLIGVKNTCVRRLTTFVLDKDGNEVAYVQWRGGCAENIWMNGRNVPVPALYSEPGEVMSLSSSDKISGEGSMSGVSEESVILPWELKGGIHGTWTGDDEHVALLNAMGRQVAMYTPITEITDISFGRGVLKLDVASDKVVEVVGM